MSSALQPGGLQAVLYRHSTLVSIGIAWSVRDRGQFMHGRYGYQAMLSSAALEWFRSLFAAWALTLAVHTWACMGRAPAAEFASGAAFCRAS